MKPHLAGTLIISILLGSGIASAQSAPVRNTNDQTSHQMNQPAPDLSDRYTLSVDRLNDIRQLYDQAKQDIERKSK